MNGDEHVYPSKMLSPPLTGLPCMTCGKQYQRNSHLRRHEATHLEANRFKCPHCDKPFGRRDVWRKHSISCPSNDRHEDPPLARRGQKPRACDACFRGRLSCDTQLPCSRCQSRHVSCSYDRLHGSPSDPRQPSHMPSPSTSVTTTEEGYHREPTPFLLDVTDPKHESMVEAYFNEPGRNDDAVDVELRPDPDAGLMAGLSDIMMTEEGLFLWNFGQADAGPTCEEVENMFSTSTAHPTSTTGRGSMDSEPFLQTIVEGLQGMHESLARTDNAYSGSFDPELAKTVFSLENRRTFVSSYFRNTNRDLPVIHRPSFDPETAVPQLIISLCLCGSMYAAPRDCVLSTRKFFRLAEEYAFNRLEAQMGGDRAPAETRELHQSLQAALLVHCLQYTMSDVLTRRRNRTLRLPALVAAVRALRLTKAKHTSTEEPEWRGFLWEETRIRIGFGILMADWQQSGMFHVPALMTIHEMTGDFPCLDALWDAASSHEFSDSIRAAGPNCWTRSSSLRCAVEALMKETWCGTERFPLRFPTMHDLYVIIYALHSMIGSARFVSLLQCSAPALLRATSRWQELWRATTSRIDAEQLRMGGSFRHSGEFCWLARRMLEQAMAGREKSAYLQDVGHDSLTELHNLLNQFRGL